MHLSEILAAALATFRKRSKKTNLDILETGSIRGAGENYWMNDGWSTLTFAEDAKEHGGSVTSIDLNTAFAVKILKAKKLRSHVTLIEGHSIDVLGALLVEAARANKRPYDVAFLDSDNDSALIFHEYLLAKRLLREPGLIVVDDVDLESTSVFKGDQILPWVKEQGIEHQIITREGDGYRTGVLLFEI